MAYATSRFSPAREPESRAGIFDATERRIISTCIADAQVSPGGAKRDPSHKHMSLSTDHAVHRRRPVAPSTLPISECLPLVRWHPSSCMLISQLSRFSLQEMDLTDRPADAAAAHQLPPQERAGEDWLARALRRARWTIFWERLWPALASIATVIGLFLAVSWLGLWLWLPPAGRAIGLGVFFLLTAAAFAPVLMLRVPSRIEGLRRLDRNSGLPHRPATAIADEIAAPTEDSYSVALWRAHIERALRAAKTLRAGTPMPRLALRDPLAVRALVAVLVVATFFAAGGERMKRIAAAFDWQGVMMPANFRIDAWVSPPPYTGRPPVILPGLRPGEPVQTAAALSVPAGSALVIRATGIHLDVVASGGLAEPASGAQSSNAKGTEERRFVINDAGAATVRGAAASD